MSRKKFSKKSLEKLLATFNGKCRMCQCAIDGTSGLEWDHRVPLAIGGEDALENLEPLCIRCHRTKTKTDVATIAKATRQRQRNLGIRKPKARIPAPPKAEKKPGKQLPPRRSLYRDAS
jgi:5-methylcytosine-specific restriction endonuclease McrA